MSVDFKKALWIGLVVVGAGGAATRDVRAQEDVARAVTKRVAPTYSVIARQARLSGTVRLALVVTPEGAVKSVRTLGGNAVLAASAEEAVKQWKFEAAKKETAETLIVKFEVPQ